MLTSCGLATMGLVLLLHAIALLTKKRGNVAFANQMLIKLAAARNLERAVKLCHAAPGTYFDAVAATIEALPRNTTDRVAIDAAIFAAFDDTGRRLTEKSAPCSR